MEPSERTPTPLPEDRGIPLCVDLDGALVKSDTLWDSLWFAAKEHPRAFLGACLELKNGRAGFKRRIASLAVADPSTLPYRGDLLQLLRAEAGAGRPLILATAADRIVAEGVARHLGIFRQVIASDGAVNRKGSGKLEGIRKVATRFLYAGDSMDDLPVWKASQGAIVAGNNRSVRRELRENGVTIYGDFPNGSVPGAIARAIRVRQWVKNLLVFLPVFFGHRTTDIGAWKWGFLVLAVFCLTSSMGYVTNDLIDMEADRQHPRKRARPFAAGDLSIPMGVALLAGLGCAALGLSLFLPPAARFWVFLYLAGALFYSLYLKTRLLADVVGLAILYVLRVMAGGAATGIVISPWTLAFCLFSFYSLALAKRFCELRALPESQSTPPRRSYRKADLPIVAASGVASGVLSVVVFSLFITSPETGLKYRSPEWLWLACPVLLYWFGRLWILANRGAIAEDPFLFTFHDGISYIAAACIAAVWFLASIGA
jgi:4-hydroxybenzoate polyprenyltransferase